jgi:predicted outer membrane repeat protein
MMPDVWCRFLTRWAGVVALLSSLWATEVTLRSSEASAPDLAYGGMVYSNRCASCHGYDGSYFDYASGLVQLLGMASGTIGHGGGVDPFLDVQITNLAAWVALSNPGRFTISGLLVDVNGQPVTGVKVRVYSDYHGYPERTVLSGADGGFQVLDLPRGDHWLQPVLPGLTCVPARLQVTVSGSRQDHGYSVFLVGADVDQPPPFTARVQHVSVVGDDANSGYTWAAPRRTISTALAAVPAGGEVWVTQGTFYERVTISGRGLYGGFSGGEGSHLAMTAGRATTILDGDPFELFLRGYSPGTVVTLFDELTNAPVLTGFTIQNGVSQEGAGVVVTEECTGTISRCLIRSNSASLDGGGIYCREGSAPIIQGNVIMGNYSAFGAGMYATFNTAPWVADNLFYRNQGDYAAGVGTMGFACFVNNTLVFNRSGDGFGAFVCLDGAGTNFNNIIAYNSSGIDDYAYTYEWHHNAVFGNTNGDWNGTGPGESDVVTDPLFTSPSLGDFHLQPGSPCVDAGLDQTIPLAVLDLDGVSRWQRLHTDLGAFELSAPQLNLVWHPGQCQLSWPLVEAAYALERKVASSPDQWWGVTGVFTNGGVLSASFSGADSWGLFRLHHR